MKVLVYENNLMWSSRLAKSIVGLGHEALLRENPLPEPGDIAIVNLGSFHQSGLVQGLKALGLVVIGHAGHKEKDLHQFGREAGCDLLATNSQLTFKLADLLEQAKLLVFDGA